jgi:CRISPR-associated helicase Cas3
MRQAPKPFETTIRRHGVLAADRNPFSSIPAARDIRLTQFQADLLEHPCPVRICSAPTGAGKTFAFEWAPALGLNILFVVPTKRLAQNLERNVRKTMANGCGWSDDEISKRLAVWSSDDVAEKEMAGISRSEVRQARVAQLRGQNFAAEGSFIIATPESVAWLLLSPPKPGHGQNGMGIADLLSRHHIVFDEFHTIEAQGFGLAAALCKVTSGLAQIEGFGIRPKISFLSATPVEIAPALQAFEVPDTEIVHLEESIYEWSAGEKPAGARIMHGDVSISVGTYNDIPEACQGEGEKIKETLASGQSVICVFDSLARIQSLRGEVASIFQGYGVSAEDIVTINSIDDRHDLGQDEYGSYGRNADPSRARVILATSSIEMGVTFQASMMIMDPGFSASSFIQRVGRVARQDAPGRVVVVKGKNNQVTRNLSRGQSEHISNGGSGSPVSIDLFTRWVLKSRIDAFKDTDILGDSISYRSMPSCAVWCAALFWVAMEHSWTNYKGERDTLRAHAPRKVWTFRSWISKLENSDSSEANAWVRQFILQARELRAIESRLRVRFCDREDHIPMSMAGRHPEIARSTICEDEKGSFLVLSRPLASILRSGDTKRYEARMTPMPFCADAQVGPLSLVGATDEWVRRTGELMTASGLPTGENSLFAIASRLVRVTSVLPSIDEIDADSAGDGTGVF